MKRKNDRSNIKLRFSSNCHGHRCAGFKFSRPDIEKHLNQLPFIRKRMDQNWAMLLLFIEIPQEEINAHVTYH